MKTSAIVVAGLVGSYVLLGYANAAETTVLPIAYPLETCVVSGEKLEAGDMGPMIDYVHKEDGKPDRLVRLCCKGCIKDFNKDPATYLKKIDDAGQASGNPAAPSGERWACPMKDFIGNGPGPCPVCGMKMSVVPDEKTNP